MKTLCATLVLLVLTTSALAADDARSRFHEAYLTEVVEGKLRDAARAYLDIMEDDGAPATLRTEARFRFGICCVLLGRADGRVAPRPGNRGGSGSALL